MRSLPPVEHTPPYWTASYEVAESLIPDGMTLTLERWANAGVLVPYLFTATIQLGSIIAPKVKADFCRTAALAVTTAALRALASQEYDK